MTGRLEVDFRASLRKVIEKVSDFNPGLTDSHQIQTRQETARDLGISPDAVVKTEISLLSGNEQVTFSHFIDQAVRNANLTAALVVVLISFITIIIT